MPDFLINAVLVGLVIAMISGPLGAFAVWRRMAYFGDTLAHSALIGVALGLLLDVNVTFAIVLVCGVLAILLVLLERYPSLSTDTLLGVLSHGSLAIGLVVVSLFSDTRLNLYGYLFGDFLLASRTDVVWVMAIAVAIAVPLVWQWRALLMLSVDEDLAGVEGRPVFRLKILLMIMMAVLIAMAMKIVGVMLITALLIIPAAAARRISASPEAMALIASILGMVSIVLGLAFSYQWDLPAGPGVVLAATLLFVVMQAVPAKSSA